MFQGCGRQGGAEGARAMVAAHPDVLTPEEDEAVLRAAGFSDVTPFYAAFTWRGWVGYAGGGQSSDGT